jgi:predicted acetyltransferase
VSGDEPAVTRSSLRPLRRTEIPAVRRLVQLYIYDLVGERWGVEADGTFGSRAWHRRFWARRGRHHFVIRVGRKLAGFALVCDRAHFAGAGVQEIAEFFVLRTYRRRGVGTDAALRLFGRFPGRWEIAELTWNVAARRFWRPLIRRCAVGAVVEHTHRHGDLGFFVQHFVTTRESSRNARRRA